MSQSAKNKLSLLRKFRQQQQKDKPSGPQAIPLADRSRPLLASFGQEQLWLLDRLEPETSVFNMIDAKRILGSLDVAALESALREIVRRHESLRTTLSFDGSEVIQEVSPPSSWTLPFEDLSSLAEAERQQKLEEEVAGEAGRSFDLATGPLFRACLYQLDVEEHVLVLNLHHSISDGWSFGVFFQELAALYEAAIAGRTLEDVLPPLVIQYADFAAWQREQLSAEKLEKQLTYWREHLTGAAPELEMPTDFRRTAEVGHRGGFVNGVVPADLTAKLQTFSQEEKVSLFTTLLTAFKLLLHRYSGQEEIVVGAPDAGRTRAETQALIGFFLNTLVLRTVVSRDLTFRGLLQQVRETMRGAFANRDVPLDKLMAELQPERHLSRTPFFQVMFNMVNLPEGGEGRLGPLNVEGYFNDLVESKFDFTWYVTESAGEININLVYNADLFRPERMSEMLTQYISLLGQAVADREQRIESFSLVTPDAEKVLPRPTAMLDGTWRGSLPAFFSKQAKERPDKIAVADPESSWTYQELDARSNQLAHYLRQQGVGKGDAVAIYAHRNASLVWALMGTLKAGAVFVLLDPAYPTPRLVEYLRQSNARAWLEIGGAAEPPAEVLEALSGVRCRLRLPALSAAMDANLLGEEPNGDLAVEIGPDDPAYIAFTSGSTGEPKGILGRHGSLTHFLPWLEETFGFEADDHHALLSALSHDPLQRDVLYPLAFGATLKVPDAERLFSAGYLADWLANEGITVVNLVPAMLQMLTADGDQLPALRRAFVVGDVLTQDTVSALYEIAPSAVCVNLYGSTETQRSVSFHVVSRDLEEGPPQKAVLSLGKGFQDVQLLVLNTVGELAGIGELGEIYFRSRHMALGYLDEALTRERFLVNPLTGDEDDRLYRTGDLGRYLSDGTVEFAGRADHQVKVRGFRIELGEIEAVLGRHSAVGECVVTLWKDASEDPRLVAYVVAAGDTPSDKELRQHLAEQLPDYMVPASYVFLDDLPLSATGKVDRKALPAPPSAVGTVAGGAMQTAEEETLAAIWGDLLEVPDIGRTDNFFELGGHSLLAMRLLGRLREVFNADLTLRQLFIAPTIAGLAAVLRIARQGDGKGSIPPLSRRPSDLDALPLSFAQQRVWFIEQLAPDTVAHRLLGALRLRGSLQAHVLERALDEVVRRHDVLRTTFHSTAGEPRQEIAEPSSFRLEHDDLTAVDPNEREAALHQRIAAEGQRSFDIEKGPLFRAVLVKVSETAGAEENVLLLAVHHLLFDGWSFGVLIDEMVRLYAAWIDGEEADSPLPELAVQYADFAVWERGWLTGDALAVQLDWWRRHLEDSPPLLELPTDRPRPAEQTFNGAWHEHELSPALAESLRETARRQGLTSFMVLLAAFDVLLWRLSRQTDLVVGSPIARRTHTELEALVGFFANTLALRARVDATLPLKNLQQQVRDVVLGASAHQEMPFEKLVEELGVERNLSYSPVFQVTANFQVSDESLTSGDLVVDALPTDLGRAQFDLNLTVVDVQRTFKCRLEYNTDLFNSTTAERWLRGLERVLGAPESILVGDLSLLSASEEHQLVAEWGSAVGGADWVSVPEQIAARVATSPEAAAISAGEETWSYAELDRRSSALASDLRQIGVGPGTVVAALAERSQILVAGLLAVWKAGGAYLPIDPGLPQARREFLLTDSGAVAVLVDEGQNDSLGVETVVLDRAEREASEETGYQPESDELAYVIYTSGSTGEPKGVEITHGSLSALVAWHHRAFALGADDRTTFLAGLGFDAAVWELWPTLCAGAHLDLPEEAARVSPESLRSWLYERKVTVSFLPTPLAESLLDNEWPEDTALRFLLTGGDRLRRRPQADMPFTLVNNYGPTESTVVATSGAVMFSELGRSPSIGRPIDGFLARVVDSELRALPVGAPGELVLGGGSLARGYRRRPALTAASFVPDDYSQRQGARIYRTGDLVRWLADGTIDFLGRLDHQVKIRGFRLELGEVEAVLARCPLVRESVVLTRESSGGDPLLAAFVVLHEASSTVEELRHFLAESLPSYMVPQAWAVLDELPLNASGKVDRRVLEKLELQASERKSAPPIGAVEEILAGIWAHVLETEDVGRNDDFFELGGHSLLATQVLSRIQESLSVELELRTLFEARTVAEVARVVEEAGQTTPRQSIVPLPRPDGVPVGELPLSFAQQRLWFLDHLSPGNPFYIMPMAWVFSGSLNVALLDIALQEIVRRHEALRTFFPAEEGRPAQIITAHPDFSLAVADLRGLGGKAMPTARRLALHEALRPFDLTTELPVRATALLCGAETVLLLSLHHIVADGWSLGVLQRELQALYLGLKEGQHPREILDELAVQYADFSVWQRSWLDGERLEEQLDYWRQELADAPMLDLPTDRPRPAEKSFRGGHYGLIIGADLSQGLHALSRARGATLYMTLLSIFQSMLHRLSGQSDIVLGAPIANRHHSEVEPLIGFFVNSLAMRADLGGNPSFVKLIEQAREKALSAYAHQDLPFERLVQDLQQGRKLGWNPFFQIMFAVQNAPGNVMDFGDVSCRYLEKDRRTVRFDVEVHVFGSEEGLAVGFFYDTDLFDATTVHRWSRSFESLARTAVEDPVSRISELTMLSVEELHQLTTEVNDTASYYPRELSIGEIFSRQARQTPDGIAMIFGGESRTYRELDKESNRLAHRLRAEGVKRESLVALHMERGIGLVTATVAVLKAGGAYLPLDITFPEQRLANMLADAAPHLLLTDVEPPARLTEGDWGTFVYDSDEALGEEPSTAPTWWNSSRDLAYVIYTSGSTGRPKGTLIPHQAISRLVLDTDFVQLGPGDRVAQAANVSFDAATFEIWGALLTGACLVGIDKETALAAETMGKALRTQKITAMFLTTALFNQLVREQPDVFSSLRHLMFGGEAVDARAVRTALEGGPPERLLHVYGPTENTTFSTWQKVTWVDQNSVSVPIGQSIAASSAFVVDSVGELAPLGGVGELVLGGDGLSRGYLRRASLTAERFVPDPWSGEPGARLYRSGDLVRRIAGSEIDFVGRVDHQVKIHGFRIELGEISAVLEGHPVVKQSVVLARQDEDTADGEKYLVAYVVPDAEKLQEPAATKPEEGNWEKDQLNQWEMVFDDLYNRDAATDDFTFNIVGWDDTATGEPHPPEEMREWLDDTVSRILAQKPRRVLELGCGTGMLAFAIAPHCEYYLGTDLSRQALDYIDSQRRHFEGGLQQLKLDHRSAEGLKDLEGGSFDTIVLNSVAQYFPGAEYLAQVVEESIRLLAPGGQMFLGDLRSLPLVEPFHLQVAMARAQDNWSLAAILQQARAGVLGEDELLVDPAFFRLLKQRNPRLRKVEIHPKKGRAHNELTRYRFQALLRVETAEEVPEISATWVDWETAKLNVDSLRERLGKIDGALVVTGIPNARQNEQIALRELIDTEPDMRVGDARRRLATVNYGIEPQALWDLASEVDCHLELSWERHDIDGRFDAFFSEDNIVPESVPWPDAGEVEPPLSSWTSHPLQGRWSEELIPVFREFLGERLPEYMVPTRYMLLDTLPLNPNGKVDRRRLPAPEKVRLDLAAGFVAPRDDNEEKLVTIWSEILGLEQVGVEDDFFELGGHSLLATQVISRIRKVFDVELALRYIFEKPTIAGLATVIQAQSSQTGATIRPVPRVDDLPLSFAQQRMWFLERMVPDSPFYVSPLHMEIGGKLHVPRLRHALARIVDRHEVLRTIFPAVQGQPRLVILPQPQHILVVVDMTGLESERSAAEVTRLALRDAKQPFDLAKDMPFRFTLVQRDEASANFLVAFHHIVIDGWSFNIFQRELWELYKPTGHLPNLVVQYADFAAWQQEELRGGKVFASQLDYWRQELVDLTTLELPTDRPRPAVSRFHGRRLLYALSSDLVRALDSLSQQHGATMYMTLLAVVHVLLHRLSGHQDVAVGSPIANRHYAEIEDLLGFFVNTLVMRGDLVEDPTFTGLLAATKNKALSAYAAQDVPFEQLVEELQPERSLNRNPLFQVSFAVQNAPQDATDFGDLHVSYRSMNVKTARFDLEMHAFESEDDMTLSVVYDEDLFDKTTVQRWLTQFERLAWSLVESPDDRVSTLQMLTAAERHQIALEWSTVNMEPTPAVTVHGLFEAQAKQNPNAIALRSLKEEVSFRQLNDRANHLAHQLTKLGVKPGTVVAVAVERVPDAVHALLGILKAGAIYLPVDLGQTPKRRAFMIEDSDAQVLVTRAEHRATIAGDPKHPSHIIDLEETEEENLLPPTDPMIPAYVIYTSGTTGRPKGVMISHYQVLPIILWHIDHFGFSPKTRVLQTLAHVFDFGFMEVTMTLAAGGSLYCPDMAERTEPARLVEAIEKHELNSVNGTPSFIGEILAVGRQLPSLENVFLGGEAFTRTLVEQIEMLTGSNCRVHNGYGPTEVSVSSSILSLSRPLGESFPGPTVPLGRATGRNALYVVDRRACLAGIGIAGELVIGGQGVGFGYLKRHGLTAEKFFPDAFSGEYGSRLYHSGDLVRYLADGRVEFLGRIDHQVKLRGFRIELPEIEAALEEHDSIAQAVVLVRDDGGAARLTAYTVATAGDKVDSSDLRSFLQEALPAYMVPVDWVSLEELPRNANGKVDRNALPAPSSRGAVGEEFRAPTTPLEKLVARIWVSVLGVEKAGLGDGFFDLGGHSLLAMQVVSRLNEEFGIAVGVALLFEKASLGEFVKAIEATLSQDESGQALLAFLAEVDGLSEEEGMALLDGEEGTAS